MALVSADRIMETTTGEGIGPLVVTGNVKGYRRFRNIPGIALNDTLFYALQAIDVNGAASGDWEIGLGTYSAVDTITRTTILASSNGDLVVPLLPGTKQVFLTLVASQAAQRSMLNVFTKNQSVTPVALVDALTIPLDAALSNNFELLATAAIGPSRLISDATNPVAGMVLNLLYHQDAVGGLALTWGSAYQGIGGGAVPAANTAALATTVFKLVYSQTKGKWVVGYGASSPVVGTVVSATAPVTPQDGQGWFDLNTGVLLTWIQDGDSGQWVEAGPVGGKINTRELLVSTRTYYVATTGSNNNDGLTSGAPLLTVQKAVELAASLDLSTYDITIQLADGTYTTPVTAKQCIGAGAVTIQGNATTPANTLLSTTSSDCFSNYTGGSTIYLLKNLKVQTTTSGVGIKGVGPGTTRFDNVVFGPCATAHLYSESGHTLTATGNYSIVGGSAVHAQFVRMGYISLFGRTVTITGTPNFSVSFASGSAPGHLLAGAMTFVGSATGVRYNIQLNSTIDTQTGNVNYLPGNSAGSTLTGAQYA